MKVNESCDLYLNQPSDYRLYLSKDELFAEKKTLWSGIKCYFLSKLHSYFGNYDFLTIASKISELSKNEFSKNEFWKFRSQIKEDIENVVLTIPKSDGRYKKYQALLMKYVPQVKPPIVNKVVYEEFAKLKDRSQFEVVTFFLKESGVDDKEEAKAQLFFFSPGGYQVAFYQKIQSILNSGDTVDEKIKQFERLFQETQQLLRNYDPELRKGSEEGKGEKFLALLNEAGYEFNDKNRGWGPWALVFAHLEEKGIMKHTSDGWIMAVNHAGAAWNDFAKVTSPNYVQELIGNALQTFPKNERKAELEKFLVIFGNAFKFFPKEDRKAEKFSAKVEHNGIAFTIEGNFRELNRANLKSLFYAQTGVLIPYVAGDENIPMSQWKNTAGKDFENGDAIRL